MDPTRHSKNWTGEMPTPEEREEWLERWVRNGSLYRFLMVAGACCLGLLYIWITHA